MRLSPDEVATMRVRRYADQTMPVEDRAARGGALVVYVPTDRSSVPWQLTFDAASAKSVCGIGPHH